MEMALIDSTNTPSTNTAVPSIALSGFPAPQLPGRLPVLSPHLARQRHTVQTPPPTPALPSCWLGRAVGREHPSGGTFFSCLRRKDLMFPLTYLPFPKASLQPACGGRGSHSRPQPPVGQRRLRPPRERLTERVLRAGHRADPLT